MRRIDLFDAYRSIASSVCSALLPGYPLGYLVRRKPKAFCRVSMPTMTVLLITFEP